MDIQTTSPETRSGPPGNPWIGFAHPEHTAQEQESLPRVLRFASIQLNKFWVELTSFPVFLGEGGLCSPGRSGGASLPEIEKLFDWFRAAPQWSAKVSIPRLVPELAQEATRARLLEFTSQLVQAQGLRAGLARRLEPSAPLATPLAIEAAIARLEEALRLVAELAELAPERGGLPELDQKAEALSESLEGVNRLQAFYSRLAEECGVGIEATRATEAARALQAVDVIRRAPLGVWQWRRPQCLGRQNRARLAAWGDRARALRELRSRLQEHFKFEERVAAAQLRLLAEKLRAGGWLRVFKPTYKAAAARYRELRKPVGAAAASKTRETPVKMAECLEEWASFLEQRAQLEESDEAKALYAPNFRGIDTAFDGALEANDWADGVRAELEGEAVEGADETADRETHFRSRLLEGIFLSRKEDLMQAVELASGPELQAVQRVLARAELASGREFATLACEEEARLVRVTRLRELVGQVGLRPATKLEELAAIRSALLDLRARLAAIEGNAEARAAFRPAFAGERTDLLPLAHAQDYIDFVAGARLPESLKASFLSAHGPQRLEDTRKLVAPALAGLAQLKEHLRRLDVATRGRSRALEALPLPALTQRIQEALKQPSLMAAAQGAIEFEGPAS